ncbi:nucleotidyltransferase domain-containing protein, partial [Candidatus Woesearchaeota archaeon]|nr:nucleotidyltransferase domain-containing protein [Candidatus Woesearchaeota archaeon]
MTFKSIFNKVLESIKPTEDEFNHVQNKIKNFVNELQTKISNAKIILGGSMAKGTWIKSKYDADVFVQFNFEEYKDKNLSEELEKGLKGYDYTKLHGSRDYFQIEDEITYEIVPTLEIKDANEALNITDASPLHTKWVCENSDETLRDEIRLTKQFFKANKLYGAESYIKGFSGYVLEILTIHHGSFLKFIKAAKKYGEKQVIDTNKHHKDVFFEVNSSKLTSPLIVIDPTQAGRNASAALSDEVYNKFLEVVAKFLENPSTEFFTEKEFNINELKEKDNTIIIECTPVDGKIDIVGCKLEKVFKFFKRMFEKNDFMIEECDWEFKNNLLMYFSFNKYELDEIKEVIGPAESFEQGADGFRKKYPSAEVIEGKWTAKVNREFLKPDAI